jgi:riboflavin synthase
MFTGLVEKMAQVVSWDQVPGAMNRLRLRLDKMFECHLGDSIAVNGCCLTICQIQDTDLYFDVSLETMRCTALGDLKAGSNVNLERALAVGDRLGGHMVSGHVDTLATVKFLDPKPSGWVVEFAVSSQYSHYLIEKGSITLDGISLTVNTIRDHPEECQFAVTLIPTTIAETTLKDLKVGKTINAEFDLVGKYIHRRTECFPTSTPSELSERPGVS